MTHVMAQIHVKSQFRCTKILVVEIGDDVNKQKF